MLKLTYPYVLDFSGKIRYVTDIISTKLERYLIHFYMGWV